MLLSWSRPTLIPSRFSYVQSVFCQLLQVLLADRLGGLPTSPGFVDGIPLQVSGMWQPLFEGQDYANGDLSRTAASVTLRRT